MRKSDFNVLLLLLILFFLPLQASAGGFSAGDTCQAKKPDPWIAPDKGLHCLGSMMATIGSAKTLEQQFGLQRKKSRTLAIGFSISLGLGKELRDSAQKSNFFSWKDLLADCLGTMLGRLLLELE